MTHGLGDIVTVIPVLNRLLASPSISLSITVKSRLEADLITLLCLHTDIKFIYFQEIIASRNFIRSFISLARRIRNMKPDIIIAQFGVDSKKSSLLSLFSGAKIRIGWEGTFSFLNTKTLSPTDQHKIDENLRVLSGFYNDFDNLPAEYPEYLSTDDKIKQSPINRLIQKSFTNIVISPGSGEVEKHKRWPSKNFSSLINQILSKHEHISVFLVGSQAERDLCKDILNNCDHNQNIHNVAGQTSIRELLELLNRADLTIANCNGVSHLACTTKSRIIGLYGPTDYRITGPKSPTFTPVTAGLECAPCYAKDYLTGCGNPICMEKIEPEKVAKIVTDILK